MDLKTESLNSTEKVSEALIAQGGVFVAEILAGAFADQEAGDEAECLVLFKEAKDVAWEKIHSGPWRDVPLVWRDVYSLCSLGEVVTRLRKSPPDQLASRMETALKTLDMALLLGSPAYSAAANALIEQIDAKLSASSASVFSAVSRSSDDAKSKPQPSTAPHSGFSGSAADWPVPVIRFPIALVRKPELPRFAESYMKPQLPVILTDAIDHWPAMGKVSPDRSWSSLDYLKRVAGRRTVPVEVGSSYLAEDWGTQLMTLAAFIDEHVNGNSASVGPQSEPSQPAPMQAEPTFSAPAASSGSSPATTATAPTRKRARDDDAHSHSAASDSSAGAKSQPHAAPHARTPEKKLGYLAQHTLFDQIPALRKDIAVPEYCALGEDSDVRINAWFGPKGTVSPLHHDPEHNFLAQVVGSKYIRLYSPAHSGLLYPNLGAIMSNTSLVDVERVDREQFPLFESAPYIECILQPGEVLYMPPRWWHYVRSLAVSFSVSFWWH